MSHDPVVKQFKLAGVPVSAIDMDGLVAGVDRHLTARTVETPGTFVVFRDAHGVVRARHDVALRDAHEAALFVCADGWPIAAAGRLLGFPDVAQVPGIDAMDAICQAGVPRGWRHYFLGGRPEVIGKLLREMQSRIPDLAIAGHESPPYRPLTDDERAAMRARIRESTADIVWIGLGTPKQELWMHGEAPYLPGTIAMGVGAAFDVHAGTVARAPVWVRTIGLEWAFRVLKEPRRLFWRYAVTVPTFLILLMQLGAARLLGRGEG